MSVQRWFIESLWITFSLLVVSVQAADPLHTTIDKVIAAEAKGAVGSTCTDAEFVRRLYLDVLGRIPSVGETRAFLADKAQDKRAKLIDKLFASTEHPRRMEELLTQMLMERRGEHEDWTKFVRTACEQNMPWDQFVRAMLKPDADNEQLRGAAYFSVNRLTKVGQQDTDYPGLTRDVGRLFLGIDLQCAQCHNHLFVDDYKQVDFQGLYAVFLNTTIRSDVKYPALTENLMSKKLDFQSVFEKVPMQVGPRVPFLQEVSIPEFKKGEEFAVPPDPKTRKGGIPKFGPLQSIADQLPTATNRSFAENIVNRMWFTFMGRGLVHPLDMRHSANPASHPKLLAALTDDMLARKFELRGFLKELALSETYQRTSAVKAGEPRPPEDRYRAAIERPVWAEQLLWSVVTAMGDAGPDVDPRKAEGIDALRKKFVTAFANPAKEPEVDFSPSVKAALFLLNETAIQELLKPKDNNLVARCTAMKDDRATADELFVAVLSRQPSQEENQEIVDLLAKAGSDSEKRARIVGHIAWALFSSTEFSLNH